VSIFSLREFDFLCVWRACVLCCDSPFETARTGPNVWSAMPGATATASVSCLVRDVDSVQRTLSSPIFVSWNGVAQGNGADPGASCVCSVTPGPDAIGLSVVMRLSNQQGGKIWAMSYYGCSIGVTYRKNTSSPMAINDTFTIQVTTISPAALLHPIRWGVALFLAVVVAVLC
jgi:hypothetical protein